MVGYTPSLSTAVWVGTNEGTKPLENKWGSPVYGSGLPSDIWKSTMDGALEDTENESFPKPEMRSAAMRGATGTAAAAVQHRTAPAVRDGHSADNRSGAGHYDPDRPTDHRAHRSSGARRTRARAAGSTAGWTSSAPVTEPEPATVSPGPLARDRRSLDDRDLPSRTDTIGAALSGVIGGPVAGTR